jgi:prepilin peptidase CpaA
MLVLSAKLFFAAVMIWAAASDLTTMTIPNRIVMVLLAGFVILAPLTDVQMFQAAAGGTIALLISFILFSRGWIGGGDAKLVAVAGLWIGADQLGLFLLTTSLFGAVLTIAVLMFRAVTLQPYLSDMTWVARLHRPGGGIPYGVAIAGAGCAVLIGTP